MIKNLHHTISQTTHHHLIAFLLTCCCSCNLEKSSKEKIEEEFNDIKTTILLAFKGDSLKIQAALYTLDQMRSNNHVDGEIRKAYSDTISKYSSDKALQLVALTALQEQRIDLIKTKKYDATPVTADYLIHHINSAVNNYKKYKWYQEISFKIFCQYILPYQIDTENVSDWMTYYQQSYFKENDSSILYQNLETRILLVAQWLKKRKNTFKIKEWSMPEISVVVADKLFYGSCHELTKINVSALRAFGVPVARDFTPIYSNRNGAHEWTTIIYHDSAKVINIATAKMEIDVDTTERRFSRVYRKCFHKIENNHFAKSSYKKFVPSYFNDPYLEDVTSSYYKTFNIDIPVTSKSKKGFCYLAVFSAGEWVPITWGESDGKLIHYKNLAGNTIYLPVSLKEKQVLSSPFFLTTSGNIQFIEADSSHTENIYLTRKYPLFKKIDFFINRMVGGSFEGANDSQFKNAKLLYKIVSNPGANYNYIHLTGRRKYRYIRYVGPPGAHCNVGEIEFYGFKATTPFRGAIIGTEGSWEDNLKNDRRAAFDGHPLTFFDCKTPDGGWAGMDLGSAQTISAIRFIARTDMNIIEKGNEYELFYWNDGWQSLGKKVAHTSILEYDNVPRKALLWLRNLTAGTEERIFQYGNGKQVWR